MGKAHRTSGRTAIVDAGFKNAALVLDETFVTPNTSHQTLEPRTAMAYWQNGKLYMHCSTQSVVQTGRVGRRAGCTSSRTTSSLISEYTGGGFGSKATGTITSIIPGAAVEEAERAGA